MSDPNTTPKPRKRKCIRCQVCDGHWDADTFRDRKAQFGSWNSARLADPGVDLNELQMHHLCMYFTPRGDYAVLCGPHMCELASIGPELVSAIGDDVTEAERPCEPTPAPTRPPRRAGRGPPGIEVTNPEIGSFFNEWITTRLEQNAPTLTSDGFVWFMSRAAYREFRLAMRKRNGFCIARSTYRRLVCDHYPDLA